MEVNGDHQLFGYQSLSSSFVRTQNTKGLRQRQLDRGGLRQCLLDRGRLRLRLLDQGGRLRLGWCFSKFGPHFKMVKSERAKKENKFVENCLNLTFTCLHFALDSGQSQDRIFISTVHVQAHFFCDLSNKDPWSMCGMQKMKFT